MLIGVKIKHNKMYDLIFSGQVMSPIPAFYEERIEAICGVLGETEHGSIFSSGFTASWIEESFRGRAS
jgi:hypothetical protein